MESASFNFKRALNFLSRALGFYNERIWILAILLAFSHGSWAGCLAAIPKDPAFDFARVILNGSDPAAFKASQLRQACSELNLSYNDVLADARKAHAKKDAEYIEDVSFPVAMINQHGSVAGTLGDSPVEQKYMSEIQRIKRITDPMERLKQVYRLSHQYQGQYVDDPEESKKYPAFPSPSKTLTMAAETGKGGQCRHFASLLNWSINQVSRGPNGEKDFSSSFESADVHSLVRVTLEPKTKSRWDWGQTFSLDPTNYDEFNPIPSYDLTSPGSVINKRRDTCEAIVSCYSAGLETAHQSPATPVSPAAR